MPASWCESVILSVILSRRNRGGGRVGGSGEGRRRTPCEEPRSELVMSPQSCLYVFDSSWRRDPVSPQDHDVVRIPRHHARMLPCPSKAGRLLAACLESAAGEFLNPVFIGLL